MATSGSGAGNHHQIRVEICIELSSARAGEKRLLEDRIDQLEEDLDGEHDYSAGLERKNKELRNKLSELEKRPIAKLRCKKTVASLNSKIIKLEEEVSRSNAKNSKLARVVEELTNNNKALRSMQLRTATVSTPRHTPVRHSSPHQTTSTPTTTADS